MKHIAAILAILAGSVTVQATHVYRYEWSDLRYSDFFGPYSGHIDFLERTGTNRGFDAIHYMEFTLHERGAEPPSFEAPQGLPVIPPRTFTLSNISGDYLDYFSISWDEQRISYFGNLLFYDGVDIATVSSYELAGFWPQPYQWDQEPHFGEWLFAGKEKLDKHNVPDSGNTLAMLGIGMLGILAVSRRFPVRRS